MKTSKILGLALSAGLVSGIALLAGSAMAKDLVFGMNPNSMAFPYDVVLVNGHRSSPDITSIIPADAKTCPHSPSLLTRFATRKLRV